MILVFGGAYQGKTDYAMKEFGLSEVCDLSESGEPDFTKEIITGIDAFAFRLSWTGSPQRLPIPDPFIFAARYAMSSPSEIR